MSSIPQTESKKRSSETFSDDLFHTCPFRKKKQWLTTTYSILSV
ncbi:hypothetical protein NEIMUCOT_03964 [Neisseria mucosa ATCC 25996]|uniref:Uncharacterized protein n=1 Tax=Neisseria mucosa (strain ATCC 25996 / DSM 4631 / NCTC 10774 / M26) TaxID=546266 RepID=D2ZTM9_NEIM2|nr:hypothetical protein NEIMUCOT_03964 [Neisseria mucosa ATCC 25996]